MAKIYHDSDADLGVLKGKKIAVIGFGSQGRAQSMCLKDSGLDVTVGLRKGGKSWDAAKKDGMKVDEIAKAVKGADVVMILVPDEVQAETYEKEIKPNLKEGAAIDFAHGFAITFGTIKPPKNVDVVMMAPKAPGPREREVFVEGFGVPALIAVEQDFTGKALDYALAYAKALKATKAGVIQTTFTEETETDLFGEQAVLCGGVSELITAGFDTLVEAGYQPEIAYFEVCHELKLIMDLIYNYGIQGMRERVSDTATYGDLSRGKRIVTDDTRDEMALMLREIQDGSFAQEWTLENMTGRMVYNSLLKEGAASEIEEVGSRLRAMMPFLKKG